MSKKNSFRSPITQRSETPGLNKDEHGNVVILCPFCKPSHILRPGHIEKCGTSLVLQAVQQVVRAKYSNSVCVKCGKGGGDMVRYMNAYIHTKDCSPDVMTMTEPPKFSWLAMVIYKSPKWAKGIFEKFTGQTMPVDEVKPDGTRTGVTLGWFFLPRGKHA
jgi:hypothetical protein